MLFNRAKPKSQTGFKFVKLGNIDSDMDQYLRARGVVSVFMTDDALGGGGSSWCGPWLLSGPSSLWRAGGLSSSLWREERLPARSQPQLHPEENCGVATGGEAGNWRALPNNNPEHELPPKL